MSLRRLTSRGQAAVVGWAMVGRGELGFVMAHEAREEGLMGKEDFLPRGDGASERGGPKTQRRGRNSTDSHPLL